MATESAESKKTTDEKKSDCGIVMPISAADGCTEQHWLDVRSILFETVESAGFNPFLVSDADDVGIIQKRIIQNLYQNPIVICDVSGKNPNVMFELGMRLAFDKPTIIVKDDITAYSFDTAPIEHLTYPRDLRFNTIIKFRDELKNKIIATYESSNRNPNYTTFLKNFGTFTVPILETTEVSKEDYIVSEISELRRQMQSLNAVVRRIPRDWSNDLPSDNMHEISHNECRRMLREVVEVTRKKFGESKALPKSVYLKEGRNIGLLPQCFQLDKKPCRNTLEDIIADVISFEDKMVVAS